MISNRTTAPTSGLLSIQRAREVLRLDAVDDDRRVLDLVEQITAWMDGPDGIVGKALITQVWTFDRSPLSGRNAFVFPVYPVISVDTMTYYDSDNAQQALTVGDFTLYQTDHGAELVPNIGNSWPTMYQRPDALRVVATCGYGSANAVPEQITLAAEVMLAQLYENREMPQIPDAVGSLLSGVRSGWIRA